jgi:hypothetical protein
MCVVLAPGSFLYIFVNLKSVMKNFFVFWQYESLEGLEPARQVFYHLSQTLSPFLL